jgi:uncharacterized protein YgbK (DUF1537 family)
MIAVIADDLTGAAELGGIALRYGLSAEVHARRAQSCAADLVAVDTDSRGCAAAESQARVRRAAKHLLLERSAWIYKKVDSVLRGHVLAELEALMIALAFDRVLLVPANPSLGRVIRQGRYFVSGRPIDETDFRKDPEYPRCSSGILEMLGSGAGSQGVCVRRPGDVLPETGIVVGEAESKVDLIAWIREIGPRTLAAGGAEFFACALETRGHRPTRGAAERDRIDSGTKLFVCGSRSDAAQNFVREAGRRGIPVLPMLSALMVAGKFSGEEVADWAKGTVAGLDRSNRAVVAIQEPLITRSGGGKRLLEWLVQLVAAVLNERRIGRLYLEGGATAAAVVQGMGWRRLRVLRELAPGVVSLRDVENESPVVIVKPGSYEWPDEIWR